MQFSFIYYRTWIENIHHNSKLRSHRLKSALLSPITSAKEETDVSENHNEDLIKAGGDVTHEANVMINFYGKFGIPLYLSTWCLCVTNAHRSISVYGTPSIIGCRKIPQDFWWMSRKWRISSLAFSNCILDMFSAANRHLAHS